MAYTLAGLSYAGLPVHALILVRGVWAKLWRVYPFFYIPLGLSLIGGVSLYWISFRHPDLFFSAYWRVQIVTMLLACGSLVELSTKGFDTSDKSATAIGRLIRHLVYLVAGGAALIYVLYWRSTPKTKGTQMAMVAFERDFRVTQALILVGLVAAVLYFGIPLGRNLKGMLFGYGIYVSSSLITLALESHFPWFHNTWATLQPWSYVASLFIYLFCLWNYEPASAPSRASKSPHRGIDTAAHTLGA